MNLQIKKFNMNQIHDDEVIVLIGKRNTGKSYLTKDLLFYHKNLPAGTVICPTEGANRFYSDIVPPILIHEEYNQSIINNFIKRQKNLKKKMINEDPTIDNRAFLILDDCLFDNSWTKDKHIREIFMNGRHWGILFVLAMQFALGIPPNLRSNIDYVFILRENIVSNRKRLYEHYAGMFPTFEMFCSTMDQCTENYECLVIHNSAKSNKLEDQVYWYKAGCHDNFKICSNEVWQYSNQNYTEDDCQENENESTINAYLQSKRKGPNLHIKKIND